MSELARLLPVLLAGVILGILFFGGLWWTIQRCVCAKSPALLFVGSLIVRTIFTMGGLYLFCHDDLKRWAVCTAGFLVGRGIMLKVLPSGGLVHAS